MVQKWCNFLSFSLIHEKPAFKTTEERCNVGLNKPCNVRKENQSSPQFYPNINNTTFYQIKYIHVNNINHREYYNRKNRVIVHWRSL
jgi:hypothetical protein